jgi:phage gp16-like protein
MSRRKNKQSTPKPDGARSRLLARVHIAKKALALPDDVYRAMLVNGWGVDSAGKLAEADLFAFTRTLEREARLKLRHSAPAEERGAKPRPEYPGRPHNMGPQGPRDARREAAADSSRAAQLQKIEAYLAEAGRAWGYADALAQRICKVDKVAWVETHELYKIITALKKDAERHDREPR